MANDYQSLPVIHFNGNLRPSLGVQSQDNSESIRNNGRSSLGSSQLTSKYKKAINNFSVGGSARKPEQVDNKTERGISKKQDCFKIQRLLGDLVERNKNKTINFNEMLHYSKGRS